MSLKVYKSVTGSKFNILLRKKEGRQVLVPFRGSNRSFQTGDVELQGLIEGYRWFKEGQIAIAEEVKGDKAKEAKPDPMTYTDVTDIQGAIEVLVQDFKVAEAKLKTPAQVKDAAAKNNVEFPNLRV
jgi:hypothetical protein